MHNLKFIVLTNSIIKNVERYKEIVQNVLIN